MQFSLSYGLGLDVLDWGRAHSINAIGENKKHLFVYRYLNSKDFPHKGLRGGFSVGGMVVYPEQNFASHSLMYGYRFFDFLCITLGASYTQGVSHGELLSMESNGFKTAFAYKEKITYRTIGLTYGLSCRLFGSKNDLYGFELFTEGEWTPYRSFYNHFGLRFLVNIK